MFVVSPDSVSVSVGAAGGGGSGSDEEGLPTGPVGVDIVDVSLAVLDVIVMLANLVMDTIEVWTAVFTNVVSRVSVTRGL